MKDFQPDYNNIINAARNITPLRIPLYEHNVSEKVMEKILNVKFLELLEGNENDKKEYFKHFNGFFKQMGYDTVSFERCIGPAMPGSGALGNHMPGAIKDMEDFLKYPWDEIPELYRKKYHNDFKVMGQMLPAGMKAVGGPGYGVFELVQDIVGYENLCLISFDDPELYAGLFNKIGDLMYKVWEQFLDEFADIYAVCRFGDDLGYKSSTLIKPEEIREHIIPQYKRLVGLIHAYNKPFLLHSCGNIFNVMDDIINMAGIDAKHSNEDQIAPFSVWVDKYGSKIGNFGGIDTDHLCRKSSQEIRVLVKDVIKYTTGHGGFALGSGNSIPDYVPVEGYLEMVETAREIRGD